MLVQYDESDNYVHALSHHHAGRVSLSFCSILFLFVLCVEPDDTALCGEEGSVYVRLQIWHRQPENQTLVTQGTCQLRFYMCNYVDESSTFLSKRSVKSLALLLLPYYFLFS